MANRASSSVPSNSIQVSGNLELTLVDLSFKTAGRMIELTVREGDTVEGRRSDRFAV